MFVIKNVLCLVELCHESSNHRDEGQGRLVPNVLATIFKMLVLELPFQFLELRIQINGYLMRDFVGHLKTVILEQVGNVLRTDLVVDEKEYLLLYFLLVTVYDLVLLQIRGAFFIIYSFQFESA